jgi:hypothetical protein
MIRRFEMSKKRVVIHDFNGLRQKIGDICFSYRIIYFHVYLEINRPISFVALGIFSCTSTFSTIEKWLRPDAKEQKEGR